MRARITRCSHQYNLNIFKFKGIKKARKLIALSSRLKAQRKKLIGKAFTLELSPMTYQLTPPLMWLRLG